MGTRSGPDRNRDEEATSGEPVDSAGPRETDDVHPRWRDPYRWACPDGHIFRREFDPRGAIECYTCQTTYAKDELVDRRSEHQAPAWTSHHARRHGP